MRVVDMHSDTILRLMENTEKPFLSENIFSVDIKKLRKANSLAHFFAMYVDLHSEEDPYESFIRMADKFYTELELNKSDIRIARNYEEIMKNDKEGLMSAILTIEDGGALKGCIENLKSVYDIGVRLITLTWNYPNELGYPNCMEEYKNKGLTEVGFDFVDEMNRMGIIIDVSHLSDAGFYNVLKRSRKPFVASHSNSRYIKDHTRNLTDDMIRGLADRGGILGINFEKYFLGNNGMSRVEDMVKHILHIKTIGGIDVIGIGSDFDGISGNLEIENIGEINKLVDALSNNKLTDDEIEKVLYKNALRVIKDTL